MLRQIIKIDEEKCDGCGLCVSACHEGAIGLVGGKAKLLRDDYCDGLGNCLPVCPTGAISFEEREAAEYNEAEVKRNAEAGAPQDTKQGHGSPASFAPQDMPETVEAPVVETLACGCPGTHATAIRRETPAPAEQGGGSPDTKRGDGSSGSMQGDSACASGAPHDKAVHPANASQLMQWPVQIKLVPPGAPYFNNANLLVAADCAAYAHGNFHNEFMRNKITLIGCPKLDEGDYSAKLTAILRTNNIKSVTVARMSVPCCGGIENAVKNALRDCGKMIPWQTVVIGTDGEIIED